MEGGAPLIQISSDYLVLLYFEPLFVDFVLQISSFFVWLQTLTDTVPSAALDTCGVGRAASWTLKVTPRRKPQT